MKRRDGHHRSGTRTILAAIVVALALGIAPTAAQDKPRPYDKDLLRLSELLGAIHYLRELCSANDGDRWRKEMQALIDAEGNTALRRVTLTKRFNKGYRSFQRTYRSCTRTALTAIDRFVAEGADIARRLIEKDG